MSLTEMGTILVKLCHVLQGHKWMGKGWMKAHTSVYTHIQGYTAH